VRFAPDYRVAEAWLRPRGEDDRTIPVDFPLDEYVATRLLGRRGALAVHACAVAEGDDALVFVGHSGAGKSTIAELAESAGAEVLSDDRTIIAVDRDGARAWGTPWHGSYRRGLPRSARVRGIFLLVQDTVDAVRPLHAATAFAELFVRTVQPTVEPAEVRRVVDALTSLVGMVSVSSLHFRPSATAYRVARASALALAGAA
jgi:ABC-type glutathione transport system ATPase component